MKKSHIVMLADFLLVIPLTLFLCMRLPGRGYYITSTLVIVELIVPFLLAFESRRPQARELVVIAVLSALAVAARVVIPLPHFKAIFAVIMLSGIAFGPEAGFMVGAVSALASNFFYGQGAYTPWQMFAFGLAGLLAGYLCRAGVMTSGKRLVTALIGGGMILVLIGPILDTCTLFTMSSVINTEAVGAVYLSGLPFNAVHGAAVFLTLLILAHPMIEKLDRIKVKYGLMEAE